MKITLNLATRPYIELRPVYARLRVMMLVLGVLALPMLLVLHLEQAKARIATARVDQLRENIAHLEAQQRNATALMQEPNNAAILSQADFLNQLFMRKAFSWTAAMTDLETTLPTGVQVISIDPVVANDGHVTVRLRITGPRDHAIQVVRNLEHSRHFVAPRLSGEALANSSTNGNNPNLREAAVSSDGSSPDDVSFEILAEYRPLPHSHVQNSAQKSAALARLHSDQATESSEDQAAAQAPMQQRNAPMNMRGQARPSAGTAANSYRPGPVNAAPANAAPGQPAAQQPLIIRHRRSDADQDEPVQEDSPNA